MIRGVENGPAQFLEASHDLTIAEIKKHLNPVYHSSVRHFAELLRYELDFRIMDRGLSSLEASTEKQADRAAIQALADYRDAIGVWLEQSQTINETETGDE